MVPHISDGQAPSPPATAVLLALVVRPDIWEHIACHLTIDELWRARRVSRHVRSACEDKIARLRKLSLECYGCNVTDDGLRAAGAACTQLTSLSLADCGKVTDEGLRALAAACTQLTSLSLDGCDKVTDDGLRAVAVACTQLTLLSLIGCGLVTDEGLRAVAAACTQLTFLSLIGCGKVTGEGLRAVKDRLLSKCTVYSI